MDLTVFGLNHRTASVALREKLALSPDRQDSLVKLILGNAASEAAILGTCNRTELYSVGDLCAGEQWFRRILTEAGGVEDCDPEAFYFLRGKAALAHLIRVASSLDSQIVGETHILGQVKECYERSRQAGATGRVLNILFQKVFQAAKKIRTETSIAALPVSTGSCALAVAGRIFGSLQDKTLLLVGSGQTGQAVGRHFSKHGVRLIISNRTGETAEQFSRETGGQAVPFQQWPELLASVDVVAFATRSQTPLLEQRRAELAVRLRRNRPLLVLDLSMPRNVDPAIAGLPSLFLYDIDAVQNVIEAHQAVRAQEAEKAERIVGECAEAIWQKVTENAGQRRQPDLRQAHAC